MKSDFHVALRERRRAAGETAESLAAYLNEDPNLPRRDGAWLRGLETGKFAAVDLATCRRFEDRLGFERDELWTMLLDDPRKVNPEVREWFEERIADAHANGQLRDGEPALISEARRAAPRFGATAGRPDLVALLTYLANLAAESEGAAASLARLFAAMEGTRRDQHERMLFAFAAVAEAVAGGPDDGQ